MKNYELLDAIGGISPKHIENASKYKIQSKKQIWKYAVPAAVCLSLIIFGIVVLIQNRRILLSGNLNQPEQSEVDGSSITYPSSSQDDQNDNNEQTIETQVHNGNQSESATIPSNGDPVLSTAVSSQSEPSGKEDSSIENYPFTQPEQNSNDENGEAILPTISSYGDCIQICGDMSVNNGAFELSDSLKDALQKNGNNAKYHVIVELYKDGVQLDSSETILQSEINRLNEIGYTVILESYSDGYITKSYLTILTTFDQINNFPTSSKLGYYIMLYDEKM